jgi:hypothetical protein
VQYDAEMGSAPGLPRKWMGSWSNKPGSTRAWLDGRGNNDTATLARQVQGAEEADFVICGDGMWRVHIDFILPAASLRRIDYWLVHATETPRQI